MSDEAEGLLSGFVTFGAGAEWALVESSLAIDLNDSGSQQVGLQGYHGDVGEDMELPENDAVTGAEIARTREAEMDTACIRAMELEFEKHKSQQLRQWEQEVMEEEMGRQPQEPGVRVEIKGGIRTARGRGTSQTMSFRVRQGEELELRLTLPDYQKASQGE